MASSQTRKKRALQVRRRANARATNKQDLQALCAWFLADESIFSKLRFHGNTKWVPIRLVWLALCWAWCETRNVTDAFAQATTACQKLFGVAPVTSYQGFMGALVTWTSSFMPLLGGILHHRESGGSCAGTVAQDG